MLTRLGAAATPEDAVGLLLECHERIRSFLRLARRVAEADPRAGKDVAESAALVARYFGEALPLHARDEEESILPRLRGREPAVDEALAVMEREHRAHGSPAAALLSACRALARDPAVAGVAPALAAAVAELEDHFEGHLRREEDVIFPAIRRLLSLAEDAAIVRELRARRAS